jgi:hypothetical protein
MNKFMRRQKFGNKRVVIDGIKFISTGEGNRYLELKQYQQLGLITELELQPNFKIIIDGVFIGTYVADFKYKVKNKWIIEDFKGAETLLFKWKFKLAKVLYKEYLFIKTKKRKKNESDFIFGL